MAAKKQTKKTTTTRRKKTPEKRPDAKRARGNRQATAIVLLALAILLLCLAVLRLENADGPTVWTHIHNFLHGCFGWCSVLLSVILGYVAVMMAKDKNMAGGVVSGSVLTLTLQAATYIFAHLHDGGMTGKELWEAVGGAYLECGWGAGMFGTLIGAPLVQWFSGIGAAIIIVLLILVFLMLTTGTTIVALTGSISRRIRAGREKIADRMGDRDDEEEEDEKTVPPAPPVVSEPAPRRRRKPNIDVELDGETRPPVIADPPLDPYPVTPPSPPVAPVAPPAVEEPAADFDPASIGRAAEEIAEEATASEEAVPAYRFPPLSLLDEPRAKGAVDGTVQDIAARLVNTLNEFGVSTTLAGITRGPSVTRFELEPSPGVKISRITGLADDIALRLAAGRVRIEAPIPNKAAVGIEIPNSARDTVCLREVLDTNEFSSAKGKLTVALGKDVEGHIVLADLAEMPHLLIAGTTGSGKSVCTNSMIQSVLYRATPDEVKLILIDPKQVEFNIYNGIPHLLVPVVTDPRKAAGALGWAVNEMERRYALCTEHNVRDLKAYNALAVREGLKPLPQILIVIDEFADLMMVAAGEVEDSVCRLAQKARAAGMHMVIATQRPSVDVITGLIKANIPSRLALTVASAVDSRTIIDGSGAEKLLGRGDMLFLPLGKGKPQRVQGCYVSDREVESVVAFLKRGEEEEGGYDNSIIDEIDHLSAMAGMRGKKAAPAADESEGGGFDDEDDMLPQAIEAVIDAGEASTSMLQRRLRIGYARAGRLIDMMEQRGIVGPHEGSKPRAVLITRQQWQESLLS